ncbi:MAG: DUF5803 family protein [Halobacteriaceae archaeon]
MDATGRRRAIVLAVAALALTAGCAGFGGGIDRSALDDPASYDWNRSANATYDVMKDKSFSAILEINNRSQVQLYRHGEFRGDRPVTPAALRFRYPNGTVVNASAITVSIRNSRTVVEPPARHGKLAFTGDAATKHFGIRVTVRGSHEVILPPNMRVGVFLFGSVDPGGYQRTIRNDRVHLRWADLDNGAISVRYYLERDFYLFSALVAFLLAAAVVGVALFQLEIRRLRSRREDVALDVDQED